MTAPYYQDDTVTLHHGDCLDVLRELPDASVDAVCTDPPYGLEFMGKEWDSFGGDTRQPFRGEIQTPDNPYGRSTVRFAGASSYGARAGAMKSFQDWCELWATECLRVLKPGGHLLAFGGSRTWHRLACAVEDAGFEIRDSIAWLYGAGFPKSLDVAKAITGAQLGHGSNSSAIRRATIGDDYEPSGVRGNRDGVPRRSDTGMAGRSLPLTPDAERWQGWGTALKPAFEPIVVARKPLAGTVAANVLAHGTGALNIDGCRVATSDDTGRTRNTALGVMNDDGWQPKRQESAGHTAGRWPTNVVLDESQAAELDRQSGVLTSGGRAWTAGDEDTASWRNLEGRDKPATRGDYARSGDCGGASRFFPTFRYEAKAPTAERPRVNGIAHPTVKPLDLLRWLVRLVTPPGGTVLEPFAGSGTTAEACVLEGFQCIAIEREADYLPLIVQRLTKPLQPGLDLGALA